jgi:DNA replication and repair protein recF
MTELELIHVRNHSHKQITFTPNIIVIHGPNGRGKTNILESAYIATMGHSHRTSDMKDVIHWNEDEASIIVHFMKAETPHTLQIKWGRQGKKLIRLHDNPLSQKELVGTLNTVIFSPEDLELIKGTPSLRRRFLNMEISQTSPQYYHQLTMYQRAVQQRNRVLKEYSHKAHAPVQDWDEQIATLGAQIIQKRLESLKKLNQLMDLMNRKLTNGKEDLRLQYIQPYSEYTLLVTKEALLSALQSHLAEDRRRFQTSVGPHRDDIIFYSGPMDLKRFGSQGQQRTAILSVKLSELEYIKSEVGEYPILLLDDVLSELDQERRQNLLKFIHKRVQTIITTTDIEETAGLDNVQYIDLSEEVL